MGNLIERIVDWMLTSSADPKKMSLMVRGILLGAVAFALKATETACAVGIACIVLDAGVLGQIVDIVVNIAFWALSIVGSIAFLFGLGRKVVLTATGRNQ